MMAVAVTSLGLFALQGRLAKRSSDPEGREELRQMEARMRAHARRRIEGCSDD